MVMRDAHFHANGAETTAQEVVTAPETQQRRSAVRSPWRDHALGLIIFLLAILFYAGNASQPVIFDDNEGLYAGAVREMTQRGDWLLPTNNGLPRIQKPPLTYWAMLGSVSLFGMNEWAIRLPNAIFTAAWVYVTFLIGLRLRDATHGMVAAGILATMIGVFVFTHLVQPEPFLATFISLSVYAVIAALQEPARRRGWYLLAWVSLALGALSKGLHGAAWPIAIVLAAMALMPSRRAALKGFFHWSGLVVFLALVAPWYLYMEARLPGFLQAHFLREQVSAAIDGRFDRETLSIPIWMFYLQHGIFFSPWVLFAPAAFVAWRQYPADKSRPWKLVWLWMAVTFLTLSFSNLQDYYAMTSWGVAALWLAAAFHPEARVSRWFYLVPCLVLAAAGTGLLIFAFFFKGILAQGSHYIAPIAERDTFANALGGISLGAWQEFLPLMKTAGAALVLGGGSAMWWSGRAKPARATACAALTLTMVVLCSLSTVGFRIMGPNFSLAEAARAINAAATPEATVACEGAPHQSSSLLFYLDHRVHWVNAPSQREFAVRVMQQGQELYWNDESFLSAWESPRQVFFIVEDTRLAAWKDKLFRHAPAARVLYHNGTRNVLVNH
ncbi:MAG: hypothetical protein B9S32_12730 [Verrucomicrobia bacterium Tous-C9LFEB]|nr:MAG: hypothetical protein B9S32_12730 [Verrucomicrobia bacterium Tous-C9LFEB]